MIKSETTILALLLFFASGGNSSASNRDTASITIIVSGETHAMLGPCDCPVEPGGGLAERASIIRKMRDSAFCLLLDAGGFGGGGIYDEYTGGRVMDSLRTLATIHAMGRMNYDAVAIGDDDLIYGGKWLAESAEKAGVPLVSTNCISPDKKPFAALFKIVTVQGIRFGIASVCNQERLFGKDDSCVITPPIAGLRTIWNRMAQQSDFQVILSHLGEEMVPRLVDSFPGCAVIVNGHRKTSASPVQKIGKTLVVQFGFEGKKLAVAKLVFDKNAKTFREIQDRWVEVAKGTAPDSAVASLLASTLRQRSKPVYDLYIMSDCVYGCAALREFVRFIFMFPEVEWNLRFIGTQEKESLVSLHGPSEVNDEMVWLAVKAVYPDEWLRFLEQRSRENATTAAVLKRFAFDTVRLRKWVRENGYKTLADHYQRSTRLAISASPTILVNNAPFEKNIEAGRLAKGQCLTYEKAPVFCDSLPECLDDGDCRKKGYIGRCGQKGACEFAKDAPFTFTMLIADSTVQHPEKAIQATTDELFPAATIDIARLSSKKGQELFKKYAPLSLPLYLFGTGVSKARNFGQIESGIVRINDAFTFKKNIAQANYFPARALRPGSAVFVIDPFSPDALNALRIILDRAGKLSNIRILPAMYADPLGESPALSIDEKLRQEEALRWMVMDTVFREKYFDYLAAFARTGFGSYWFLHLGKIGIAQDRFVRSVETHRSLLADQWKFLQTLAIKNPVTVMLDNREIVVIRNEKDLDLIVKGLQTK